MSTPLTAELIEALRAIDTPTVCNALEIVAPERRAIGFTTEPLVCARPKLPPIVGHARTATIRAKQPSELDAEAMRELRLGYYAYVAADPAPAITVIQDLDRPEAGYGAFWGEVNTAVHRGLGCIGCVTDGSIRDLDDLAPGFQLIGGRIGPSHAHVHVAGFDAQVNVAGMLVRPGDIIHADQHGAVVIPDAVVAEVPAAADRLARREAVVLEVARAPGFNMDLLRKAWADQADIH